MSDNVINMAAYSASEPTPGLYRARLVRGGVFGAIRIWHGPPNDPVTGEELDRSHRWQCTLNESLVNIDRFWPACGKEPVDQAEYDRLVKQYQWAQNNAPDSAYANLHMKLDPLSRKNPLPQ